MTSLCCELLEALKGRTFSTAESCTGGGIGSSFTAIPGSSAAYMGGVICYTNWVKENILGVSRQVLDEKGAVSAETAQELARGVRKLFRSTMSVSVTGIAGPESDDFNTPVGTVYIGFADETKAYAKAFAFSGDRTSIRLQAIRSALEVLLYECNKQESLDEENYRYHTKDRTL